jgi:hypothetical protein
MNLEKGRPDATFESFELGVSRTDAFVKMNHDRSHVFYPFEALG